MLSLVNALFKEIEARIQVSSSVVIRLSVVRGGVRGVRLGPEVALVRVVVLRLGVGAVDHEVADLALDDLVVEPLAVHDGRVPDGGAAELVGARVPGDRQ